MQLFPTIIRGDGGYMIQPKSPNFGWDCRISYGGKGRFSKHTYH